MKRSAVVLVDPMSSGVVLKQQAKEEGLAVICVFTVSLEVSERVFRLAKETRNVACDFVIESADFLEIEERLRDVPYAIRAVIAGSESGVLIAELLAHELELAGNKPLFARRNKWEMRRAIQKAGLSCPDFQKCPDWKQAEEFAKRHSFPLVIKTPEGVWTSNVFVCETMEELKKGFHQILTTPDAFGAIPSFALVEEYLGGNEYIVDLFSNEGEIHVTDVWVYEKGRPPGPKNLCWNCRLIPPEEARRVADYAKRVAQVLRIEFGPSHAEIKDDPKRGPVLIEIGARLCGAGLPQLLREASNFDLFHATLQVFVEGRADVPHPISIGRHFAIVFGVTFEEGVVERIEGIEEIQKLPSYVRHLLFVSPGQFQKRSVDGVTTPLFVYLGHKNRKQLESDIEAVHDLFKITIH